MRRETSGALDAAVRYFTRDTGIMDGMLLVCGTESRELAALDGEVRENSVFDLASLTKLFTGLCGKVKDDTPFLQTASHLIAQIDVYASLGDMIAEDEPAQEELDGYILSAYTGFAMPHGELSGALTAEMNALQGKPQDEPLPWMRQLKALLTQRSTLQRMQQQSLRRRKSLLTASKHSSKMNSKKLCSKIHIIQMT